MKNLHNPNVQAKKQGGFIMTTELVLIASVMVIGSIAGLVTMRDAVTAEMEDVAEAIGAMDQSYAFDGIKNGENTAELAGSSFGDAVDTNAGDGVEFSFIAPSATEGNTAVAAPDEGSSSSANTGTQ